MGQRKRPVHGEREDLAGKLLGYRQAAVFVTQKGVAPHQVYWIWVVYPGLYPVLGQMLLQRVPVSGFDRVEIPAVIPVRAGCGKSEVADPLQTFEIPGG